jgi:hypothetical protein
MTAMKQRGRVIQEASNGNMMDQVLKAIHIGVGGYVAAAASAFLAFAGLKSFLSAKA